MPSGGTVGELGLWAPALAQLLTLHVTSALSLLLLGPWFTIGHGQGGDWMGSEFNKALYAYGMHALGVCTRFFVFWDKTFISDSFEFTLKSIRKRYN